ncbi:MAG: acyl-CoA thioesterase [Myxococcales bacterium]|jgi:MYXO-CTERM domain-containing protein|nr:acyl-CoA thioesterase [Myxococcales bacterium]
MSVMKHWLVVMMGATAGLGARASTASAQTKVACVGDSITAGAGSTAGNDYPSVLGRLLGAGWQVRNFGDSGKTMMKMPADPAGESYWLQPRYPASKAFAPAIVVIMLGTNDSKTANWRAGNNMYDADYRAMIGEYQALPSKPKVFAVLPPPSTKPSFTIDGAVIRDQIVPIIRKIARDLPSIELIDVFDAYLPMPDQYLTDDGVHPNDKGHALLAQTVASALTAAANADGGSGDGAAAGDAATESRADVSAANDGRDTATSNDVAGETAGPPGTGGSAGTGGATGSGGTSGGAGGAAADVGGDTGGVGASPTVDCSCRTSDDRAAFGILAPALLGLLAIRRRRRVS